MDSFIYALVLAPALRDLLPASGKPASAANLGFYGGLLFAIFLIGWGFAFAWGPVADRFGRVKTWMHTGYYFGFFVAAGLNYWIGAKYGWRAMFALGGTPALLVALVRYGVHEPARWKNRVAAAGSPFARIFSPVYRRRTLLNALFLLIAMIGLWAGSVYVPGAVSQIAAREGRPAAEAARLASWATMLLSIGTILGCLLVPYLAGRFGRRGALGFFFGLMGVSVAEAFGYAFYLPHGALTAFIASLFFVGVGGASFCVFTVWLPEQYGTDCRASAFAFATSSGRFVAATITFLVGAGVSRFGTIGIPVAFTAAAFLAGLILLPWGEETKGKTLPA